MRHREPPPLAMWMLRHLTAGYRDEALDGDLLEVYRLGRTSAWYWRQVASTCTLSWCSNMFARGPVLVFALVWSMLAPVWYTAIDRLEASTAFDKASQMFEPIWLPLALIGWMVIHAVFFWVGLLIFRMLHEVLRKPIPEGDFQGAFRIAPLVFPFICGVIFVVAKLYWYSIPGLAEAKLPPSVVGQVTDLGILAALIRLPYFAAMVVALWRIVPRARHDEAESSLVDPSANAI